MYIVLYVNYVKYTKRKFPRENEHLLVNRVPHGIIKTEVVIVRRRTDFRFTRWKADHEGKENLQYMNLKLCFSDNSRHERS